MKWWFFVHLFHYSKWTRLLLRHAFADHYGSSTSGIHSRDDASTPVQGTDMLRSGQLLNNQRKLPPVTKCSDLPCRNKPINHYCGQHRNKSGTLWAGISALIYDLVGQRTGEKFFGNKRPRTQRNAVFPGFQLRQCHSSIHSAAEQHNGLRQRNDSCPKVSFCYRNALANGIKNKLPGSKMAPFSL